MNNIKKNTLKLKRNAKAFIIFIVFATMFIGAYIFIQLNKGIASSVENQAKYTLENVNSQNLQVVDSNILEIKHYLNFIAREISYNNDKNTDNIVEYLKRILSISKEYEFYNLGVIDENGICKTTFGDEIDLSKYSYFKDGIKGEESVSPGYLTEDGRDTINIFSIPIKFSDGTILVLTGTYKTNDFLELMNVESFEGNGGSFILDSKGNAISLPDKDDGSEINEISKYISANENVMFKEEKSDKFDFKFNYKGKKYSAYCEKMDTEDWYLLTYVPSEYLYENSKSINRNIMLTIFILYGFISLISIMFLYVYQKFNKRIVNIVFKDKITNDYNYQYFLARFDDLTEEDKKNKYLIVFDVDNFKIVNLLYGLEMGDIILKYVHQTFKECCPNDKIYRYNADTFVGVINAKSREEIIRKINKISKHLIENKKDKNLPDISLSWGICALDEFSELNLIYNNALMAKNEIKGSIDLKFKFFDDTVKRQIEYRNLELAFNDALKNKEFKVWYQPKYDMRTGKICGSEALVRWQKVDGTVVSPGEFIPVFETTGQIVDLDKEVLKTVCADINEAKKKGIEMPPVSVNLSKLNIKKAGIIDQINEIINSYSIDKDAISFEMTESVSINDKEAMNKLIDDLRNMGFKVEIDDYGTGSSTLKTLSDSNFDTLKLDRSFISSIGSDKMNTIVKSTINMANNLNMKIVAEGVESEDQINFLVENNCYIAQGYYFSKPIEKDTYFKKLKNNE